MLVLALVLGCVGGGGAAAVDVGASFFRWCWCLFLVVGVFLLVVLWLCWRVGGFWCPLGIVLP